MSPVPLLNRQPGMCAYPVAGEGEAALFCGTRTGTRLTGYCDAHAALMTTGTGRPLDEEFYVSAGNVRPARPARGESEPAALDAIFGRA